MGVTTVPSLDDVAAHPETAASLPVDVRQTVLLRALGVILACATVPAPETGCPAIAEPDRVVGMDEAANLLHMTRDFLYRNWATLGLGFKDSDGHVKFPLSKIQRYIRSRAGR